MVINFLNRSGNAEGEQIAPMELNPSSQRSPLLPSFALDSPSPPSTRILYQSNFWNSAEQGPDRCGCPSCCAALASTALPSTSNGQSEAPEIPLHWKIDQALSTESLDSILNA
jgi:hypothetical protein